MIGYEDVFVFKKMIFFRDPFIPVFAYYYLFKDL